MKNTAEINLKPSPVKLTSGAVEQLNAIRASENIPDYYCLRVGVKGGGCAGFSYILGFDEPKEQDELYDFNGMKIIMNRAHGIYLIGIEIDFHQGLQNRGFTFNNPNASDSCGCGTSFSA
jgi:iron-sulfur cluster assembly protein